MDVRLKTIKRDEFTISIPDESASVRARNRMRENLYPRLHRIAIYNQVGDLKKLVEETKGSAFPAEHTKLICAGNVTHDWPISLICVS